MNCNSCQISLYFTVAQEKILVYDDWKRNQNFNRTRQDTQCCTTTGFKVTNTSKISNRTSTHDLKLTNKVCLRFNTALPIII